MFESSQFLDIYLPEYFLKVFDRNYSNQTNKKIHYSPLQVVSQFVKFSHSIYASQNLDKQFFCFLLKQFPFLNNQFNSKSAKNQSSCDNSKGKILELIELNLDKINQMFIGLYIKIFQINLLTKDNSFHKHQVVKHSQEILKDLTHIRLLYQIQRFQTSNLKEFDDYIIQVFKLLIQDDVTKDMENIIKKLLRDECSNVNEGTIQQIQQLFNKQDKQALKIIEKNEERSNLIFMRGNLAKKHKKIEKSKTQCTIKKTQTEENHFSSPLKSDKKKQIQSYSPINRIKNYMRNKKEKQINNKKRTIYFERKNVHLPKVKEWIDKMSFFSSQLTLTSEMDKKTEKKLFKLQPSQSTIDDYDNQSILVRSTPKPNKKYSMGKMISHKLDF